jgi:peptidoglycan/xylan/chitin deacetylase (PgdA/CDA1 family)
VKRPVVLAYHDLVDTQRAIPGGVERSTVTFESFEQQLAALLADGWRALPLRELVAGLTAAEPLEGAYFALTFDDGYASARAAAPILERLGVPATLFVIAEAVGGWNQWNSKALNVVQHLGLDELRALVATGRFAVQLHGLDHHRLTKFPAEEVRRRLVKGQEWFQAAFGRRAEMLAYPYGDVDDRVAGVAAELFDYGLSVSQGAWAGPSARHRLNRMEVTRWMDGRFLADFLSRPVHERRSTMRVAEDTLDVTRLPPPGGSAPS